MKRRAEALEAIAGGAFEVCVIGGGARNNLRPCALEPLAGHHAMLDVKNAQQNRIDHQRPNGKNSRAGINGFRGEEIPHKTDDIEKRHDENQVCNDSIEKRCNFAMALAS